MAANHHHNHVHHVAPSKVNLAFGLGIGLNLIFTIIEFVIGWWKGSLALMSDAGHNLTDVGTLIISLIGLKLASIAVSKRYTYGYKKATILASLINAVILLVLVGFILLEVFQRIQAPQPVPGIPVMVVAGIGILINAASAFLFFKEKEHDINIRGAYLHLVADAAVSLGVVLSGLVIYLTGWQMVDPIISVMIVVFILLSSWALFRESVRLIIDAVPKHINYEKVIHTLKRHPEIKEVHHVHIWPISSSSVAITAHLIPKEKLTMQQAQTLLCTLKKTLREMDIDHATLEFEFDKDLCDACHCE